MHAEPKPLQFLFAPDLRRKRGNQACQLFQTAEVVCQALNVQPKNLSTFCAPLIRDAPGCSSKHEPVVIRFQNVSNLWEMFAMVRQEFLDLKGRRRVVNSRRPNSKD